MDTLRVGSQIIAARQSLADARQHLRRQHQQNTPAIQVCAHWVDELDAVLVALFTTMLDDLRATGHADLSAQIAFVPHGGYGRRDMAPFSDVDLMLLHSPAVTGPVRQLANRLLINLCDAGLDVGYSTRTPAQAVAMSRTDPIVFSSLVEARLLAGSSELFENFKSRFQASLRGRRVRMIRMVRDARRTERLQYGDTVYLLEPNIKRSPGGLRELHLLRWAGFARYGVSDFDQLLQIDGLSRNDHRRIKEANEFLLQLRNELHFNAGRSYDVLSKSEQLRIAAQMGYGGNEGVLPVEQFMQDYFRHTGETRSVVAHFVSRVAPPSRLVQFASPLLSHQVERHYRVGPYHIRATAAGKSLLKGNVSAVLRLMDLANQYDKRIDTDTWMTIRTAMEDVDQLDVSSETITRFLSILAEPARLADILRRLHELHVLEKIIPGMRHARCLLQFNEYHKYTVDEHSFRAVECATEFLHEQGPLGHAYRSIKRKRTLHLALLLHDLGKGYVEDHSEVGRRLAVEVAEALRLGQRESEKLVYLVHRHLAMVHLAFRRDTSDESIVVQFAYEVGTPDTLKMLFVLSCADLAAVGPGTLNDWKVDVLTELYLRTMKHLAGDAPTDRTEDLLAEKRITFAKQFERKSAFAWYRRQIEVLPDAYLRWTPDGQIVEELGRLEKLEPHQVDTWARYLPERSAVQFTVGAYDQLTPGIFHKLTGALTSFGLQILAADIYTLGHGLVLDRFYVQDPDFEGEPPVARLRDIRRELVLALSTPDKTPQFRRTWGQRGSLAAAVANPDKAPTRVIVDNSTAESFSIIDVFALDRIGLLYTITRTFFELGLSVSVARIWTYVDQVVDVFYVTDANGEKIEDEDRILNIKQRLHEAIESDDFPNGSR